MVSYIKIMATLSIGGGGLNPCCNGRWSRTLQIEDLLTGATSLNPCCNGRWSRTCYERIDLCKS